MRWLSFGFPRLLGTALSTILGAELLAGVSLPLAVAAQEAKPPKTYIDQTTGRRVIRLTDEPNSTGFYFNNNAYSPDDKLMIYTAPDGIHVLELAGLKTRLLVPNPPAPADTANEDPGTRYRRGVHNNRCRAEDTEHLLPAD